MRGLAPLIAFQIFVYPIVLSTGEATACDCSPVSHQTMMKESDLTFEGKVLSIVKNDPASGRHGKIAILMVTRAWKGIEAGQAIPIQTNSAEMSCGVPFEQGKSYLVHAYSNSIDNVHHTSLCMATRQLTEKSVDPEKVLGAPLKPGAAQASRAKSLSTAAPAAPKAASPSCALRPYSSDSSPNQLGGLFLFFAALACLRSRPNPS